MNCNVTPPPPCRGPLKVKTLRSKRVYSFSGNLNKFLAEKLFISTQTQNCVVELSSDFIASDTEPLEGPRHSKTFYWGGSARTDRLPTEEQLEEIEIFAVRGPATISALKLSPTLPQGDLTLFLPVFYKPEIDAATDGKKVFIPDENDDRPDSAFARTGCDIILRPIASKSRESLFELIDAIVSAQFVLTSSLAVAMVAAAYRRPFAHWPKAATADKTAWQDFTALMDIPFVAADNVKTAQTAYNAAALTLKPRTPALSAFLASAPFPIRPEALLNILDHEIRQRGNNSASLTIDSMARNFMRHRSELNVLTHIEDNSPIFVEAQQNLREQELETLVKALETKAKSAEIREQNLLHSIEILGEKIGKQAKNGSFGTTAGKQGTAVVHDLMSQLERERSRIAELEQQLVNERNVAQFEGSMVVQQLAETRAALDDARNRYHKIHNSRTWSLVRKSRKLRQNLSPKGLLKKARKALRKMLRGSPAPKQKALQVIESVSPRSSKPSEVAIVIADLMPSVSAAASDRIKSWISQGYDVVICGQPRNWSHLGATVVTCDDSSIIQAVNRAVTDSRSAFVALLNSPEHDLKGLEHIKPAFANFDQMAMFCAVENHGGTVLSAGACFEGTTVIPMNKGARVEGATVTRIMPTQTIWPAVTVLDQDSFMHLAALPFSPSLEAALIAYAAKVRARGLEIGVNGLLTTEQPTLTESYTVSSDLLDALGIKPIEERPWVLFTDGHTPTPDKDSGSIDIYWFLRIFKEMGYQVAFMPYHVRDHAGRYTDELRLLGIETIQTEDCEAPWQHVRDFGTRYDLALVYRVTTAAYILEPLRTFAPQAKIIFDTVDLHFLREEMAAKQSGNKADEEQAKATRVQELKAMKESDATIVLSSSEDKLIGKLLPKTRRKLISLVRHIPGRTKGAEGRKGAIFVGGFRHTPNIDAALYLCKDIWPLVRQLDPSMVVDIIGADAPEEIMSLHNPAQGINVVGRVPTLDAYYENARMNLAPLTFGAGVKGKVAASLSVGLPTIGTNVATDGMWLTDGKDVLVADTPQDFAYAIVNLNRDDELWETLSVNGIDIAREHFSIETARSRLSSLLSDLRVKKPNA